MSICRCLCVRLHLPSGVHARNRMHVLASRCPLPRLCMRINTALVSRMFNRLLCHSHMCINLTTTKPCRALPTLEPPDAIRKQSVPFVLWYTNALTVSMTQRISETKSRMVMMWPQAHLHAMPRTTFTSEHQM